MILMATSDLPLKRIARGKVLTHKQLLREVWRD